MVVSTSLRFNATMMAWAGAISTAAKNDFQNPSTEVSK